MDRYHEALKEHRHVVAKALESLLAGTRNLFSTMDLVQRAPQVEYMGMLVPSTSARTVEVLLNLCNTALAIDAPIMPDDLHQLQQTSKQAPDCEDRMNQVM